MALTCVSLEFNSVKDVILILDNLQSQAIKTPTAIYCSGQIPLTADGTLIEGTIAEKTRKCCENLDAVLKQAGSSLPRVVKTTIFISDMDHFAVSHLYHK